MISLARSTLGPLQYAVAGALFALTVSAQPAVQVVPTMTIPHAVIDMDNVGPAGPTTFGAVLAGATGGVPAVSALTLTPNGQARGVYNTSAFLGRALGLDAGGLALIDPPSGGFDAFDAQIDFALPTTEFGLAVGDWVGDMKLDFYLTGTMVATFTSPRYSTATNGQFFFQMTGGAFDRIDFTTSSGAGNWVIAELHVTTSGGYAAFGSGCMGSNGVPDLQAAAGSTPQLGQQFTLQATNLPLAGGPLFIAFGASSTQFAGLGALPFDLAVVQAPGCLILCDVLAMGVTGNNGGSGSYSFTVPNDQALVGTLFFNQAYANDASANPLGLTVSNGGVGQIQ